MKINYPAVFVAAIVHFIIGGLWYGLIFGNKFIEIIGWSPAQVEKIAAESHWSQYAVAFATSLVLVYILAHFVQYTGAKGAGGGMQTAFWLWLGFVATTQLATVVFEQRKLGLYLPPLNKSGFFEDFFVNHWPQSQSRHTAGRMSGLDSGYSFSSILRS
jgi:hypothetical protein